MKANNTPIASGNMQIEIPRAGYKGAWSDFCRDNEPFFFGNELDRIGRALLSQWTAKHVSHTAGEFVFVRTA